MRTRLVALLCAALLATAVPALADAQQDLVAAVAAGDAAGVLKLLHAGAYVDATDQAGETPLLAAARRGDPRVVTLLLNHGASVTETDNLGRSPLQLAKLGQHWDVVDMLEPQVAFATAFHKLPLEPGSFVLDHGTLERARSGTLVYTRFGMPLDFAVRLARVLGGPGLDYANPVLDGDTLSFPPVGAQGAPRVEMDTRYGRAFRVRVSP